MAKELHRALAMVLVLVLALGVLMWRANGSLETQVDRWESFERIDQRREQLIGAINQYHRSRTEEDSANVAAAFEALRASVAHVSEEKFAEEANRLVDFAHAQFSAFKGHHLQATLEVDELREALADIYAARGDWSTELNKQLDASARRSFALEQEQRHLSQQMGALSNAMVEAGRINRKIEQYLRNQYSGPEIADLRFDLSRFPDVCGPGDEALSQNVCTPSSERVRETLDGLKDASIDRLKPEMRVARLAIDAYSDAGQARYDDLTLSLVAAIDASQEERVEYIRLRSLVTARNAVNTRLARLESHKRDLELGLPDADPFIEATIRGIFTQVKDRVVRIVVGLPQLGLNKQEVEVSLSSAEMNWEDAMSNIQAKRVAEGELEARLNELAAYISTAAEGVRLRTGHWIDVFLRSTLLGLLLFAGLAIAMYWAAVAMVTRPLEGVTATILALASGETNQPIRLKSMALGFDRLGGALEQLRQSNIERRALLDRNAAQKRQIEENMIALEQSAQEMERRSLHDHLTSLPNRRYADLFLNELESAGHPFGLLHIDVDRFKEVNDTLGHEAGDYILAHVADIIQREAGTGHVTFRIGGDEFLIARSGHVTNEDLCGLAGRIVEETCKPVDFEGNVCRVGASIGIALGYDAGFDSKQTLINADLALYEAKKAGRGRFALFTEEIQSQTIKKKELSDRILQAIENREFIPYYQPQFETESLALRGVETLCRWDHPELGVLTPGDFLERAEELRVVGKIDQIIFDKAAADLDLLRANGLHVPKISFNITAERLLHSDLVSSLKAAITPGTKIGIELLESMSFDSLSASVQWSIDTLKEAGISVEIDDFGSSRASIAGLIAVGPDAMKIDGEIIRPITESSQHLRLIQAIVEIGSVLGIEVVAEGAETEEHVEILRRLRCHTIQGFALARPMPADELAEFLQTAATLSQSA